MSEVLQTGRIHQQRVIVSLPFYGIFEIGGVALALNESPITRYINAERMA